ncbi:HNH endonuclease [Shewanella baltica]|uniref:HNH endonuclease n=1 Tax=Shewanella baltica TaxID=62322 RepID=UPI00321872BF
MNVSWVKRFFTTEEYTVKYFVCSERAAWRGCSGFGSIQNALFEDKGASTMLKNGYSSHIDKQRDKYGAPYFCVMWLEGDEKFDKALIVNENEVAFVSVSRIAHFDKTNVTKWDMKYPLEQTELRKEATKVKTSLESIFSDAEFKVPFSKEAFRALCEAISNPSQPSDIIDDLSEFLMLNKSTEIEAIIKSRVGQGHFRKQLIDYWKGCAVSGCKNTILLKASHIKPWAKSNNQERLDFYNGLLLIPGLDTVFDAGLITFSSTGEMQVSDTLPLSDLAYLGVYTPNNKIVGITDKHAQYLEYHRKYVFEYWLK